MKRHNMKNKTFSYIYKANKASQAFARTLLEIPIYKRCL